jgi:hypothetical protein
MSNVLLRSFRRASLTTAAFAVGLCTLLLGGTAHAAVTLGRTGSGTGTTSAITITMSGALTTGSLLVASVSQNAVGGSFGTITPPASWSCPSALASAQGTAVKVSICYLENQSSTGTTVGTFSCGSTAGTTFGVQVSEFKGILTSSSLDATGIAAAASSNGLTVSGTATAGQELAVAAFVTDSSKAFGSNTSGFTDFGTVSPGSLNETTSYNLSVASGTVSDAATIQAGKTGNDAAVIATFQAIVTPKYWIGGGTNSACTTAGNVWSSASCWSDSSGGASSSVPTNTTPVIFDNNGTGDCTINSAAPAASITVTSGYSGTITHSSNNITLSGALSVAAGTFTSSATSSASILTNGTGSYTGDLIVSGGTFSATGGVVIHVRALTPSGGTVSFGSSAVTADSTMTVSGTAAVTMSTGTTSIAGLFSQSGGTITTPSGAAITLGTGVAALSSSFTMTGGTFTQGAGTTLNTTNGTTTDISGTATFNGTGGTQNIKGQLNVNGGTMTLGTAAMNSSRTGGGNPSNAVTDHLVSVGSSGTLTFTAGFTFPQTASAMTMAGTINAGSTGTVSFTTQNAVTLSGTYNASSATTSFGATDPVTLSGTYNAGTSVTTFGSTLSIGSAGSFSGSTGTQHFANAITVDGTLTTGTANLTGTTPATQLVTIDATGTMSLAASGFAFLSTTAMPIAGTLNLGSGNPVSFAGPITLTGTLNAQSSTTTITGAVTMTGTSVFSGGTGTTTFTAAPTLTAGTFTVGTVGTTHSVIFTAGATFATSMSLVFPTSGGTLSAPGGQAIAINCTVSSSAGTAATPPKISQSSGTTGITISFGSSSRLNIDGLEFDNSVAGGVTIADGATYTTLKHLTFKNNVANSTSTGATHLSITSTNNTSDNLVLQIPGCYFDATVQYNVTLSGTALTHGVGVRAIFEYQSTSTNGSRAGPTFDLDADTNGDNVADSTTAPRYGSVIEWTYATETDTVGIATGYPTAAFDWNTFQYYGIYVAYSQTAGAGSSSVLWNRKSDGTANYSYTVPSADGDIVGTPRWDAVNENTAGFDVNGNGNATDSDVRVVYIATSLGHIIKLIDNNTSFAQPATGKWSTDFTSANVATITSPLAEDGTNLYFGGTDTSSGSSATEIFGVQVAGGANEKTLVKEIASLSAIQTAPSWTKSGGNTYVYLGSTATSSQAYIYRIDMTSGSPPNASFTGATTDVNDAVVLMSSLGTGSLATTYAYAVTSGGQLEKLDALNFNSGAFTNVTGFPYQTAAAKPIKFSPWIDINTAAAYFGDDGGSVYVVTSAGAAFTGFPLSISASIKITSSPFYRSGGGVIAVGASDGYLYFIDRNNGSAPNVFKRFFVTSAGSISSVSYNPNNSTYMVSSSDGKLVFVNASDVTDPTSGSI